MDPENNNLQLHAFSAFKRTLEPQKMDQEIMGELEAYCQQLLTGKKKIALLKQENYYGTVEPLTHLLIDITHSLQQSMRAEEPNAAVTPSTHAITHVTISLFKTICLLVQESLVTTECKFTRQLMSSMLFEKGLVQTFRKCFLLGCPKPTRPNSQNNLLTFADLDSVLRTLAEQDYRRLFLPHVFALHSGSAFTIDRSGFTINLKYMLSNIGKIFTEKTNLITRNLKNVKKSKFINEIVSSSIKTICNYRNEEFINEQIGRVTQAIFGADHQSLHKQQFCQRMGAMLQMNGSSSMKQANNLAVCNSFLFIDLLRVETVMIHDPQLVANIEKQMEINSSNFYTQEMQKLLKKCPYNGDECCSCKKCQCVRRNRESAKLSQEKKRNAVEQLDPMKKRIEELQKRNKQLEEQNRILRVIVKQLKNNEGIKSVFNSTIQSVSKVLDD